MARSPVEAGQFPALDVADPHGVGVTEVLGEPLGPGRLIGGIVEAAGEQGGGAGMFAAWHADRSFGRDNRDHVHDKMTAHIGGSVRSRICGGITPRNSAGQRRNA